METEEHATTMISDKETIFIYKKEFNLKMETRTSVQCNWCKHHRKK